MKTVFFDIDTQIDFLYPAGALYVPGADKLVPHIAALNRYAASKGIVVVSTMDAHTENDIEFQLWPPHCVTGTTPQAKPALTMLDRAITIPSTPVALPGSFPSQILLQKQTTDCFTNQNINALLDALEAGRCVVYGVVTEICVKNAALGLLKADRAVDLVLSATQSLDEAKAEAFLEAFRAGGGSVISSPA